MQGNTISTNVHNESGKNWIERSFRVLFKSVGIWQGKHPDVYRKMQEI